MRRRVMIILCDGEKEEAMRVARVAWAPLKPTVYAGETTGPVWRDRLQRLGWGRMWIKLLPRDQWDGEPMAIDNGVAADHKAGRDWDGGRFEEYVEQVAESGIVPDFVVLPDVFADWRATVARSWTWLDRLPEGWPRYLVLQDGAGEDAVAHFARVVEGVFLGGSKPWRAQHAAFWREWTRERDLPLHWGGCARIDYLRAACRLGYDSTDSVQPMWDLRKWREYTNTYKQETGEQCVLQGMEPAAGTAAVMIRTDTL